MIFIQNNSPYDMIKRQYLEDPELLEKYHSVSGSGIEGCVNYILDNFKKDNAKCYVIYKNDDEVGFFADGLVTVSGQVISILASFYIRPKYRKILTEDCWKIINNHLDNKIFTIGIYKKNIKACRFFEKKASKIINSNYENKDICIYFFNLGV